MVRSDAMSTISRMPMGSADGWILPSSEGKLGTTLPFCTPQPTSCILRVSTQHHRLARRLAQLALCLSPQNRSPGGREPAACERVGCRRASDNLPASIRWAEVIGRAPQSTWCYLENIKIKIRSLTRFLPLPGNISSRYCFFGLYHHQAWLPGCQKAGLASQKGE